MLSGLLGTVSASGPLNWDRRGLGSGLHSAPHPCHIFGGGWLSLPQVRLPAPHGSARRGPAHLTRLMREAEDATEDAGVFLTPARGVDGRQSSLCSFPPLLPQECAWVSDDLY